MGITALRALLKRTAPVRLTGADKFVASARIAKYYGRETRTGLRQMVARSIRRFV
jgi:hypothetical protein